MRKLQKNALLLLLLSLGGCAHGILKRMPMLDPAQDNFPIARLYEVQSPQFERTVGSLLGPPIIGGNSVDTLVNGDQIFPAMLEAISAAQKNITLETYIYWDGDIGKKFSEALIDRRQHGVNVHLIVDWFGLDRLHQGFLDDMKKAGIEVRVFHEIPWYNPLRWGAFRTLDNRTHRKLLVVDGKVGFIGGVGIADQWKGDAKNEKEWRDNHYRIVGPAVSQLQSAFVDNWLESGGALLHGDDYFPEIPAAGDLKVQAFKSSSGEATDSMELMYRVAIAQAKKSIKIESAYFVPDEGVKKALEDAAKSGVVVEVMMPGPKIDQRIVRSASRAAWSDLLGAGIRLFEYQPTMIHCKVMIVDDYFVSVGSTNFDSRSFHLNDEANLNVFNSAFANEQSEILEADKKRAREITLEDWKNRPFIDRFEESLANLFRGEL